MKDDNISRIYVIEAIEKRLNSAHREIRKSNEALNEKISDDEMMKYHIGNLNSNLGAMIALTDLHKLFYAE